MAGETVVEVKLDSLRESVEDLKHRLFGNGQPGKFAKIDDDIGAVETRVVAAERKLWMASGAFALLGVIATLAEIWYHAGQRPH